MSDEVVALGTLMLAVFTAALAFATFRLAKQTKKLGETASHQVALSREANAFSEASVDFSRQALEASLRPMLADVPSGAVVSQIVAFDDGSTETVTDSGQVIVSEKEDAILCSFPLRNVGSGVGLIVGLGLRFGDRGWSGKASVAVIPPREGTRLAFTIPRDRPELRPGIEQLLGGQFTAEVRYTDANGAQPLITRISILRGEDARFRVRQVFLVKPGVAEPFAASGPSEGESFARQDRNDQMSGA